MSTFGVRQGEVIASLSELEYHPPEGFQKDNTWHVSEDGITANSNTRLQDGPAVVLHNGAELPVNVRALEHDYLTDEEERSASKNEVPTYCIEIGSKDGVAKLAAALGLRYDSGAESLLSIHSPLTLVFSNQKCWRCETPQKVVALAIKLCGESNETKAQSNADVPNIICEVRVVPEHLLALVQNLHPNYRMQRSRTLNESYYANFCECGAKFGDHYLFMEPGGAFSPLDESAAAKMITKSLKFEGTAEVTGTICYGAEDLIFRHAKRS